MSSGIPGWSAEEDRFLDRLDRVTWRVARVLALGVPVWFGLLLAVPHAIPPIGPMPALALATLGAAGVSWANERRVSRARRAPPNGPPAPGLRARRRLGTRALVLAGAVLLFAVYAILVIVAGGGR